MSTALVLKEAGSPQLLDQAKQLLAKAQTLPEVLKIRNMAKAAEQYFKAANDAREIANGYVELKLRAERVAGEMLRETRQNGQRAKHGHYKKTESRDVIQLADLGVSGMQSHRWQAIAAVPTEVFEGFIAETRKRESGELTTSALMHMAKKAERKNKQDVVNDDPEEPPSPEEARRIAIETGQSVLDSEGWYQPPISIEREEEIARILDLLDLITELSDSELMKYRPRNLLEQFAGLRKHYHVRLRDVSLDGMIAWLMEFENERKKHFGR